ncbi:carbohydrate ABC transporter permease [Acutalibacter sp. 1XD8-33]|uniref:carbohydrate ABC transporter permease n=1 Tax=Acutalibacter sp. 1XD8-33 TaxID=2320081 RepID=UPI000EA3347D|nr:carbohydrate ABC transporter permease [Acutalibacter sp. 1XD8-33]RKJ41730.1 carbohydrate ABC transporter permease [Acutalibacter sp. 1XD8-33]
MAKPTIDIAAGEIQRENRIKTSVGEKCFTVFNYTFFTLLCLIMLYPFWHVLMQSLSSTEQALRGGIFLYPKDFSIGTYQSVFKNPQIYNGFATTIFVTAIGSTLGTLLTAMTAYPLSKSRLRGSKIIMFLVLFTMIFSAGMIPNYLLIRSLGLYDSRWALILPGMVSAYNCILMKNFFLSIPEALEESARIDGANDMRIFFSIILPLSKATIATIMLFNAVMYWNDYFSAVLYIRDVDKWPLQTVLRQMLTNTQQAMQQAGVNVRQQSDANAVTIKAASIVVATVPILIVYPFVQKHFVKGVMIGGVKG